MQSAKGIGEVHINLTKTRVPVPLTCLAPAFRPLEIGVLQDPPFSHRPMILLVKILSIEEREKCPVSINRDRSSYTDN